MVCTVSAAVSAVVAVHGNGPRAELSDPLGSDPARIWPPEEWPAEDSAVAGEVWLGPARPAGQLD